MYPKPVVSFYRSTIYIRPKSEFFSLEPTAEFDLSARDQSDQVIWFEQASAALFILRKYMFSLIFVYVSDFRQVLCF